VVKRISCRVVKSVPLSKSGDALWHARRSNNKHRKISNIAGTDVGLRHTSDSFTYTGRRNTERVSIDDKLGQILDCYI